MPTSPNLALPGYHPSSTVNVASVPSAGTIIAIAAASIGQVTVVSTDRALRRKNGGDNVKSGRRSRCVR